MHGRPDGCGHWKCRESCARRAYLRYAAHPRAHHGGVAENLTRPCYAAGVGREEREQSSMGVLVLLFVLLSMPAVATGQALAQQTQQKSSGSGSQSPQT